MDWILLYIKTYLYFRFNGELKCQADGGTNMYLWHHWWVVFTLQWKSTSVRQWRPTAANVWRPTISLSADGATVGVLSRTIVRTERGWATPTTVPTRLSPGYIYYYIRASDVCMYVSRVLDRQLLNGWCHRHQYRRLCSRPYSHESVISSYFWDSYF